MASCARTRSEDVLEKRKKTDQNKIHREGGDTEGRRRRKERAATTEGEDAAREKRNSRNK